ncbi:hypothetical protein EDD16DRAFT_1526988 [Pisolithus croceorrhizus]|nr:hypothetical protein EDD16DRAFT_1526988 [Pisolithus croceorrhizus]KAI6125326.1 hypothetical protein EV401DRAFT_1886037 [Pisolithus croceorrhizus]KAI6137627.1 hypothetical protein EDD17DRAFT_1517172 [Pisolithus thermaeus]
MPSGVEGDGENSNHAIFLEGISMDEFEHFVSWVYHVFLTNISGSATQQHTIASLTAILKISQLWMIENSIQWAITNLEQLDLSPAHKLELARKYTIPGWIPHATQALIFSPLSAISDGDVSRLGLRVYSIITKAREMVECERKTIAAVPPGLSLDPDPSCLPDQHQHCREAWIRFWWHRVAWQLLHPTKPLALCGIIDYIANQPHPDGLRVGCRERYVGEIIEGGGLHVESEIVGGATAAIEAYFASL